MSRMANLLVVVVLALSMQGCLAAYKEIIDVYDAIFGVPAGVEQKIFSYRFGGPGSYCFQPGTVSLEGRIFQRLQDRSSLQIIARHVDESGDQLWAWKKSLVVKRDGTMPERVWPFAGRCIGEGERLSVYVKPAFDIIQNGRMWTRFVYHATDGATPW
jgi:hypothetical protein